MKTLIAPLLVAFLATAIPTASQDEDDYEDPQDQRAGDTAGPRRFWQATLPGGHYMVALDRISSISRHKYILDGAMVVDEVTIDSLGQALARFYVVSPISAAAPASGGAGIIERGRELVEQSGQRVGADLQSMVVKKYPDTSHARTIEYRIADDAQLTSLYTSIRGAWESGRGRQFTGR